MQAIILTIYLRAVIKTTGSAFENFVRDEYTTLVEVNDRIFSTAIDLTYTFGRVTIPNNAGEDATDSAGLLKQISIPFNDVAKKGRRATTEIFALDDSASVQVSAVMGLLGVCGLTNFTIHLHALSSERQATLYKMCERVLSENADVLEVGYALPNKHYIPVDMRYIGVDNLTPLSNFTLYVVCSVV